MHPQMNNSKKRSFPYMLVGQVESVLVYGHNVLGGDKQATLDPLDKRQAVRLGRVVKQLDNIALVRMVDDEQAVDPCFCIVLELEKRHSCRVEIVVGVTLECALFGRPMLLLILP